MVDEVLDRSVCRTLFGRGYGRLVSHATEDCFIGKAGVRVGL